MVLTTVPEVELTSTKSPVTVVTNSAPSQESHAMLTGPSFGTVMLPATLSVVALITPMLPEREFRT